MGTVNISIPDDMIAKIDGAIKEMGYASRSEFVRDALRKFLIEAEWISKLAGNVLAVVTMTFNRERRGVSEDINRVQHKYENIVLTTIHNHLGRTCLEVILTRGNVDRIREFAEKLRVMKGVETVKVAVALTFPK